LYSRRNNIMVAGCLSVTHAKYGVFYLIISNNIVRH
jgi:hypothetical protein